jgi:TRAP transporter 4TM/12TM fusion protein
MATDAAAPPVDVEELIRKKDVSERFRKNFAGRWRTLLVVISCVFVAFSLYFPVFGKMQPMQLRGIHLGFILALTFLYYPARKGAPHDRPSAIDLVLIVLGLAVGAYVYFNTIPLALRAGVAQPLDYWVGAVAILLVLEACRRALGYQLLAVVVILLLYAAFGRMVPGALSHRGYSLNRIIYQMFLTTEGIFSLPLGISATYMVLFIVLAAILGQTGLGRMFNDVAIGLTGKMPGGPAKVAVVASGLLGMINGSAATNVATTGTFTIPLMKKVGYKPYFAGAVEAAASTGGQIMPPVMGTVAFLMAEFIGVPYIRVAAAAVIPAVLYFGAVYFAVDFRARKRSLRGVSDEDVPNWKASLAKYAHMLLPLVALVYLLIKQYTPLLAAFVSLVIAYVLSWLRKDTRLNLNATVKVAVDSSKAAVSVAVAMANAGFIIGVLGMTGLGLILTDTIIAVSGGFVLVSLLLVAIVTIVLGMGLPTTGAFVIGSTIAAPILIKMGTPVLVANFFVLYYACLSTITPPVALAAYVGAGMAGANPNKVGWTAFRLALPGLLIAFFFAQNPALLLIADNAWGIIFPTITSLIGIMLFAAGSEGYFFGVGNLPVVARVSLIAAAVLLLDPRYITDVIALGVLVFGAVLPTVIIRLMQVRRRGAAAGRKPAAAG